MRRNKSTIKPHYWAKSSLASCIELTPRRHPPQPSANRLRLMAEAGRLLLVRQNKIIPETKKYSREKKRGRTQSATPKQFDPLREPARTSSQDVRPQSAHLQASFSAWPWFWPVGWCYRLLRRPPFSVQTCQSPPRSIGLCTLLL